MAQTQMIDEIGSITQGMVSAFNEYLGGVHPVMSSGGSNGAADTLTNWDGSEVTNGWRTPARPNFLGYPKKKGGGWSYWQIMHRYSHDYYNRNTILHAFGQILKLFK